MKVISGISKVRPVYRHPVMALGVFDGVHLGHQRLIKTAVQKARSCRGTSMVMTFFPHPLKVLRPHLCVRLITSLAYRLQLIERLGVDVAIIIPFTRRFSKISPSNFIHRYLVKRIQPAAVIVGDDFRFGQNREGTLEYFYQQGRIYGFDVLPVATLKRGEAKIGSSRIRQAIAEGDLPRAARLLGRPVSLMGRIVRGDGRGRKLGYPTANVVPQDEVVPPHGVYVVRIRLNGRSLFGIANVGLRPSFHSSGQTIVETYIFNFRHNIYGSTVIVEFLKKLRDERKFFSPSALTDQIAVDERLARQWLQKHKPA